MIRAFLEFSASNVMSTRVAFASNEFLTSSKTAMKSFVISSLPIMVFSAELTRKTGVDLGITDHFFQHVPCQFGKQRWNRVANLRVAGDFLRTPVAAGRVFPPEFKIVRE